MKNRFMLLVGLTLLSSHVWAQNVCISTPETSLVLNAPTGGELKYIYYGTRLNDNDLKSIEQSKNCQHVAYPYTV